MSSFIGRLRETYIDPCFFSVCPEHLGADAELLAREPQRQDLVVTDQEDARQVQPRRPFVGSNVDDDDVDDVFAERQTDRNFANLNVKLFFSTRQFFFLLEADLMASLL